MLKVQLVPPSHFTSRLPTYKITGSPPRRPLSPRPPSPQRPRHPPRHSSLSVVDGHDHNDLSLRGTLSTVFYLYSTLSHSNQHCRAPSVTMPSLRRTLSAPSRSSPYSSSTQTRTSPRSPRRSSGSDTANRRVLADIDWWRVEEGQREVRGLSPDEQLRPATPASDEEEVDQEERAPSPVAATLFTAPSHNSGSSTDLPLWHNVPGAGWDTFDGFELPSSDIDSADPFEVSCLSTHCCVAK